MYDADSQSHNQASNYEDISALLERPSIGIRRNITVHLTYVPFFRNRPVSETLQFKLSIRSEIHVELSARAWCVRAFVRIID
jgi:hypothetical protein